MSSFLHSAAWERFQRAAGHQTTRHQDQLYTHTVSAGFKYATSSRLALEETNTLPHLKGLHFLRLEPINEESLQKIRDLSPGKLVPTSSVQPRQTVLVDLTATEADLLSAMHSKHRYNIRLAARHGVTVNIHSTDLDKHFERFWRLLSDTANRQRFRTHPREYYAAMCRELEKDGSVHLLFAQADGEDLATMLLITHAGTATYLHGASSPNRRELMAPYALHWEAMSFARENNCTIYDLWGTHAIQNEETAAWEPIANHASAGVTRLKLGFGGIVVEYPGTFDMVLQPIWYSAYTALRAARTKKRAFS